MSTDNRAVVILGGGGHAKVLISSLRSLNRKILGITDPDMNVGEMILGMPVLGGDDELLKFKPSNIELVNGVGSLPGYDLRWFLIEKFEAIGFGFSSVIHPSAIIDESAILEKGVQVMAGCVLQADVKIGRDSIINTGVIIDHDSTIGSQCCISPGVTINGGTTIGDNVFIGAGSIVLQGLNIAQGTIIGAGSLVLADTLPDTKYIQVRTLHN